MLKKNLSVLKPTVWIGKQGITDAQLVELDRQLAKKKVVKVKFLRSFLSQYDRREAALLLAEKSGADIVKITGSSAVFHRK